MRDYSIELRPTVYIGMGLFWSVLLREDGQNNRHVQTTIQDPAK